MSKPIGHLVSQDLLEALRAVFPLQRPMESDSDRRIWIKSGQQEVIDYLQTERDRALEQALNLEG